MVTYNNERLGLCEGRKSVEQGSTAQCGWCSLLLQWCVSRCITEFHHIDFLPSGLGAVVLAALCNSDSRSLLCRLCLLGFYLLGWKNYCFLVDFILRVTTTRFKQTFTVYGRRKGVCWLGSFCCLQLKVVEISFVWMLGGAGGFTAKCTSYFRI